MRIETIVYNSKLIHWSIALNMEDIFVDLDLTNKTSYSLIPKSEKLLKRQVFYTCSPCRGTMKTIE